MAVISEIEVKVAADVKDLTAAMVDAKKQIATLGPVANATSSSVSKSLSNVAVSANKLDSSLGKELPKGANQAGNALLNLGRIAQDAPFGFVGISNNINPLLESFQRLKVETGTTKGALSALSSSLMGGAGLGLAVSVATGLLTVFAGELFKTSKAQTDAADKAKAHKDAIESINKSVAQEQTQVLSLIAVIESENSTRKRKNDALKELQSIQPDIFKGLKLEGETVIGLDAAYQKYIKNLSNVIAVKILQNKLDSVSTQLLEKQGATLTSTENKNVDLLKSIKEQNIEKAKQADNYYQVNKLQEADVKFAKETNSLLKQQEEIVAKIKEFQSGVDVKTTNDDKVKKVKDYRDIIAELRKEVRGLDAELQNAFINQNEFDSKKVDSYAKAIKELGEVQAPKAVIGGLSSEILATQIKVSLREGAKLLKDEKIEVPTEIKIKPEKIEVDQKDLDERLKLYKDALKLNVPIVANFSLIPAPGYKDNAAKEAQKIANYYAKTMKDIYQQNMNSVFSGVSESIANAVLGKSDFIGSLFQGLTQMLGEGLVQFGKQMILASTLLKALTEAFGGGEFGKSLIGGIALVALGSVLKGIKIGSNATGTDNWRGGLTMVGERGPELLNLPRGSQITPNHELGAIGGGMQPIVLTTAIRGNDLVLIQQRTNATLGRIG